MKILNEIKKIFDKYELNSIDLPYDQKNLYTYLNKYPEKRNEYTSKKTNRYLNNKYIKNINKNHYGFDIGTPIIPVWVDIIDEITEYCINVDKDFEIQQIKIKFGILHYYCKSKLIEDLIDVEVLIMTNLQDKALAY